MPELPEVETLRRDLERVVIGKTISHAEFLWPKSLRDITLKKFNAQIKNKKIMAIGRRAKILSFELENGARLAVHLKMTGQLIYIPRGVAPRGLALAGFKASPRGIVSGGHPGNPTKHTRIIFHFTDGAKLYFNDLRKFGWLKLISNADWQGFTAHLGPEPLEKNFTQKYFNETLNRYPKRKIKQLLLDQTLISGIGNIYADESLFLAQIKPSRVVKKIIKNEKVKLYQAIKKILALAITKGGTSIRDYRRSDGKLGNFAKYLKIYNRSGEKCLKCATLITKVKQNGRGTHYCATCQK
ncbi:MAG: DNA-formamidopyrimidine glycosylase [Patescibacteria group bacterium]